MRLIFMGSPEFGVGTLIELVNHGHEILHIFSQPPKPAGRGMKIRKTPIHEKAEELNIPVSCPTNLNNPETRNLLNSLKVEACIVIAYGLMLPKYILRLFPLGCINIHASYLPRWRGASPIQSAIASGDDHTGVSIIEMNTKLDSGSLLLAERVPIEPDTTFGILHDKLAEISPHLLIRALAAMERGSILKTPQNDKKATYCYKIKGKNLQINWSEDAETLEKKIRAFSPIPGCYSHLNLKQDNNSSCRLKIYSCKIINKDYPIAEVTKPDIVGCGKNSIQLLQVQLPGRKVMKAADAFRGIRNSSPLKFTF